MICPKCDTASAKTITARCPQCAYEPIPEPAPSAKTKPAPVVAPTPGDAA